MTSTGDDTTSVLHGVEVGVVEPGCTVCKTVQVCATSIAEDRSLNYCLRFKYAASSDGYFQKRDTVVIPFTPALAIDSSVTPQNCSPFLDDGVEADTPVGLLAPSSGFFSAPVKAVDIHHDIVVASTIKCMGPWDISVRECRLVDAPAGATVSPVLPPNHPQTFGIP